MLQDQLCSALGLDVSRHLRYVLCLFLSNFKVVLVYGVKEDQYI